MSCNITRKTTHTVIDSHNVGIETVDQVRVSGAKKDDLQAVIQTLKAGDFGVDLQFINMR